jgi:hypothetical protein
MYLPYDPMMLLSVVNMKLRDSYESLDELCDSMDVCREDLEEKLRDAGFTYNVHTNQFT